MKFTAPRWVNRCAALAGSMLVSRWMETLDYRGAFYDPTVNPVHPEFAGAKIYCFWHEYMLLPLYLQGNRDFTMLLSQHRDAEIMSHVAHFMGHGCVRGSTYKGAAAALRELMKVSQRGNLSITPDGPRGPRHHLAQGPIYLASKLGLPLVMVGFGCDRPWRLKSWDRFAIPRPFSRARVVCGPAIHLPRDLDRAGIEHYRLQMQTLLQRLSDEANAWAESGTPKRGEIRLIREPLRRPFPSVTAVAGVKTKESTGALATSGMSPDATPSRMAADVMSGVSPPHFATTGGTAYSHPPEERKAA